MIIVVSFVICLFLGHFFLFRFTGSSQFWFFLGCKIVLVVMRVRLFKDPYGLLQKYF